MLFCCNYSAFLRFKPVQLAQMLKPLRKTFDELFRNTFDLRKTNKFLSNVQVHGVNYAVFIIEIRYCPFQV